MDKPIFRANYTVLNAWSSGNWDGAIEMYFSLKKFTSRAMGEGKDYHDQFEEETRKTGHLPAIFGGKQLNKPVVEFKNTVKIEEWLQLKFKIDCLDEPTIYEYKTGKETSESYAESHQLGVYGVGCTLSGIFVNKAEVYHFDQYTKKVDMSVRWITKKMLENDLNWIVTISSEMHNYFLENDLYNKFGKYKVEH